MRLPMPNERDMLQVLRGVRDHFDADVSLESLSARAGWSPFHLHRAFRALTGETPKQYMLRLRLERATVQLLMTDAPIVTIAARVGFASHEVFTRAFRRHFHCTPTQYRARGRDRMTPADRRQHAEVLANAGPCVGLFHLPRDHARRHGMPMLSIERRELTAQHTLVARLRPARHELSQAIAQGVGKVYMYALEAGIPLAGHPFTRYLSTGPGILDIEVGFHVPAAAPGRGEVEAGQLPGGSAAVAVHAGSYEQLGETYAAAERWMEQNGIRPGAAPWEWYVTDPAEHPDSSDWRTQVFWPIAQRT
jgi:AraC family transcriptional regulator